MVKIKIDKETKELQKAAQSFVTRNNYDGDWLKFIDYCKTFENKEGYLTQSFFQTIVTNKAKFISGPFTNMVFEIIERQKNKLKILIGSIVTTIPNKANYLYRPI